MTNDRVRSEFEAWAKEQGYYIMRQIDGYLTETDYAWQGYQSALRSPLVMELVELLSSLRDNARESAKKFSHYPSSPLVFAVAEKIDATLKSYEEAMK